MLATNRPTSAHPYRFRDGRGGARTLGAHALWGSYSHRNAAIGSILDARLAGT